MTNLLLLSSHGILEYDELRLFDHLGYDVFCPGGYSNPAQPGETLRPGLPEVPFHADLAALCDEQYAKHAGQEAGMGIVDWAKADLHPDLIAWADIVMVNCFPAEWIGGQWEHLRGKRVIWRTIGQSNPWLEHEMSQYRRDGLEIVRYSPAERRAFEPTGAFAGEDAVIRFAKFPGDFEPWIGDDRVVGNITQNLDLRGEHCGLDFWQQATAGLPTKLAGFGSERMGGIGTLPYPAMLDYLRHLRVFLYMGTEPASYTLALMEVMLAGVPVVSIGPKAMWMPPLFEAHELVGRFADEPLIAKGELAWLLADDGAAQEASDEMRRRGQELFGADVVGRQWTAFLGAPDPKPWRVPTGSTALEVVQDAAGQVIDRYRDALEQLART
jgi:hypothetical protein